MRRRRLLWQIYLYFLLITLVPLFAITRYASSSLRNFYYQQTQEGLEARAQLLRDEVVRLLRAGETDKIDPLCKDQGNRSATRITIILPSGKVVGDTDEDPAKMENHADRPEILQALDEGIGVSERRYSATRQREMMYVALRVLDDQGKPEVIVRTSVPVTAIDEALRSVQLKIAGGGLIIALLVVTTSLYLSRRISRPLEDLKRGAELLARGERRHRLSVEASDETGSLADSMNRLVSQLDERIRLIAEQRNEREAILSSMVEGVLAVDTDEHLISINHAAAEMLEVDPDKGIGKSIQEIVRNPDLQKFIARTLADSKVVEGDIVLHNDNDRFLQANGAALRDSLGKEIGAVVVLNDITRIRRLEGLRREFVANVSHELKTPITSIKGFVETLQDGAIHVREDAERFLGVVAKQVDRLNAIIEDLLLLSKVEQDTEDRGVGLEEGRVLPVLQSATEVCLPRAEAKEIEIDVQCPRDLEARMNLPLLEQAVINLIDNAVKYSEPKSPIQVEAHETADSVVVSVTDHGCGIAAEYMPRLFERFYRVDKARSRKLGGTGLGLAIVKHIAQAHGGRVDVESTPEKGSTFFLHLPRADD